MSFIQTHVDIFCEARMYVTNFIVFIVVLLHASFHYNAKLNGLKQLYTGEDNRHYLIWLLNKPDTIKHLHTEIQINILQYQF